MVSTSVAHEQHDLPATAVAARGDGLKHDRMADAMTAVAVPVDAWPSTATVAGLWARHLLALYLPLNSLIFLWTGPHSWLGAVSFMVPLIVAQIFDCSGRREQREPLPGMPAWPFDALVYLLAALQIWVVVAVVRLFSMQTFFSFDMLMVFLVVGSGSGFSIVTAHELIHRRKPWEQVLGRLLLCTVLYEHFYTEHIRGHHVRVGTPEDPATARFGEAYEPFFRRTVPAQFRSAWRLELARLGDAEMHFFDRRMLRNRIVHGLVLEWGVALAIFACFGFVAGFAFVLQAFAAVRLLEAVNYFEHWGLQRTGRKVRAQDSWDTHSWFTYYGLIGLTRHADHHAAASRPYQLLRIRDEAPLLPVGYVGMVDMVMGRNPQFQQRATAELARRGLGPFATDAAAAVEPAAASAALKQAQAAEDRASATPAGWWTSMPIAWRRLGVAAVVILVTAIGVHWESGAAGMSFVARLFLHTWILATFIGTLVGQFRLEARLGPVLSWVLAFTAIAASGITAGWMF